MRGHGDIACAAAAALMLTGVLVVGACAEHIPAYALVSDDAGADASADAAPEAADDAPIDAATEASTTD